MHTRSLLPNGPNHKRDFLGKGLMHCYLLPMSPVSTVQRHPGLDPGSHNAPPLQDPRFRGDDFRGGGDDFRGGGDDFRGGDGYFKLSDIRY